MPTVVDTQQQQQQQQQQLAFESIEARGFLARRNRFRDATKDISFSLSQKEEWPRSISSGYAAAAARNLVQNNRVCTLI